MASTRPRPFSCGHSLGAKRVLPKDKSRVRFPLPAQRRGGVEMVRFPSPAQKLVDEQISYEFMSKNFLNLINSSTNF